MKSLESMSRDELVAQIKILAAESENGPQRSVSPVQMERNALETEDHKLREARQRLEEIRNSYADLFDFTPVGYVTFDSRGVIREINLTGAEMLGRERSLLINTPFISHLVKSDRKKFLCHLAQCKQSDTKVISTISVTMERGNSFHLQLQSVAVRDSRQDGPLYRTAIIDMSEVVEIKCLVEELTRTEEKVRSSIATELRDEIMETIYKVQNKLNKFAGSSLSPEHLATVNEIREYIDISIARIEALVQQICPTPPYKPGIETTMHTPGRMNRVERNLAEESQTVVDNRKLTRAST